MKRILYFLLALLVLSITGVYILSQRIIPTQITYGVSFSKLHADDLHLDWKETYLALLNDLSIKHLRLSAHWPMVEPEEGLFHFDELDFQMNEAASHTADVILAVGRRLPSWPECHDPAWALNLSTQERQQKQLSFMAEVVNRYKQNPALKYWQVENEAYLYFAPQYCGTFDESFFEKEIALVRKLDPVHPVLLTDSGEVGKWYRAWQHADVFATSLYLYVWYDRFGFIRYPIGPWFFRAKLTLVELLYEKKPAILSELGAEPWLPKPLVSASLDEQLQHMSLDRMRELVTFASKTGFSEQYLWGAEWWYYMKKNGHPEFWNYAKELYSKK